MFLLAKDKGNGQTKNPELMEQLGDSVKKKKEKDKSNTQISVNSEVNSPN